MVIEVGPFPEIERIEVNAAVMAGYTSESEFVALAVELLKEAVSYVCVAACTLGSSQTWDREQATVGGNMVRLFKLLSGFLDQTCQKRRETSEILGRLAFETVVNVSYLIAHFSPALVDSYIRYSMRHERKLRDTIQTNIATCGGDILPIETRMLESLERTARVAGISLDSIDMKDKAPWGRKNIYEKARAVGMGDAYLAMFGGLSHNVHGSWQDLYDHHLAVNDEGVFTPTPEWDRPRPQLVFALGVIVVQATQKFFEFIDGEKPLSQMADALADLARRIREADTAHESYLVNRKRQMPGGASGSVAK